MRPADVAWDGFPLLWRRPLDDETFAFDLFIGRPVLHFTHRRQAGADFAPLRELAGRINQVSVDQVRWRGLEEIARHAYVQRRDPEGNRWEVLMTTNLACLHNDDRETRRYRVCRPQLPASTRLAVGKIAAQGLELEVEVPPGETVLVQLIGPDVAALPDPLAGRSCTLDHEAAS
jgi:hypothetical protein